MKVRRSGRSGAAWALGLGALLGQGDGLERTPGEPSGALEPAVQEMLDAFAGDDWGSERVSKEIHEQLELLGEEAPAVGEVAAHDFACGPLRPALETVFDDGVYRVERPVPATAPSEDEPFRGPDGLARALAALDGAFLGAPRTAWKVVGISLADGTAETTVRRTAVGRVGPSPAQQNALWRCRWRTVADGPPRLVSIEVSEHEEVRGAGAGPTLVDATEAVLGGAPCFAEQLEPGLEAWRGRLDASLGVGLLGHEGLAVGDFDGDGLEDLYVCQPGGLPNRLFLARPDGTTREGAAEAGLDWLDMTRSALLVELDGDAGRDLVLGLGSEVVLLSGDGRGHFEPRASFAAPTTTSLAAADVDGDGDLDVYACGYVTPYDDEAAPVPYHDAENGQPNLFLRNDGDWHFVDATDAAGLGANNHRFSFAASFEDFDDDGDPDLYVANDFGRNNLYRNEGGTFVDVAAGAGVEDVSAGMGITWGDFDGDGRFDLYVSNMYSSAGSRVTYQRRFHPDADPHVLAELRHHARGNSLFRNVGDGTFEDASLEAGVTMGRWAWGATFFELNGDGRPDLLVPNGFVTGEQTHDL